MLVLVVANVFGYSVEGYYSNRFITLELLCRLNHPIRRSFIYTGTVLGEKGKSWGRNRCQIINSLDAETKIFLPL